MSTALRQSLLSAAQLVVILVVCWQLLYWTVGDVALRSPLETLRFTVKLIGTDTFGGHLAETAKAFGIALVLAIVVGLVLGFLLGLNRFASEVLEPLLIAFNSVPKITLYPILLLVCGLGIAAKIAFGFIHGIIPIALFTIAAVHNVRPVFRKTARVMGLSTAETILKVLVPAALPEIFAGLRIGFALTLIGTLLGEMFASQRGLGYLLMSAIGLHNIDLIMALTFLLTLFAGTASGVLLFVNRRIEARRSF